MQQFTVHVNTIDMATMKSVQLLSVCIPIGVTLFRQGICHIVGEYQQGKFLRSGEQPVVSGRIYI